MPSTGPTPQAIKPDFNKAAKAVSKTQTPKLEGQQMVKASPEASQGPSQQPALPSYQGPNFSSMSPGQNNPPPLTGISLPVTGLTQPTEPSMAAYDPMRHNPLVQDGPSIQLDTSRKFYR